MFTVEKHNIPFFLLFFLFLFLFDPLDSLYENEHKISVSNQYWNDIRFLLFDNSGLSGSFFRRFAITVAIEFVYEIIEPIVEEWHFESKSVVL